MFEVNNVVKPLVSAHFVVSLIMGLTDSYLTHVSLDLLSLGVGMSISLTIFYSVEKLGNEVSFSENWKDPAYWGGLILIFVMFFSVLALGIGLGLEIKSWF